MPDLVENVDAEDDIKTIDKCKNQNQLHGCFTEALGVSELGLILNRRFVIPRLLSCCKSVRLMVIRVFYPDVDSFAYFAKKWPMFINRNDIPRGESPEETKQRSDIIWKFYQEWKKENPTQKVYNNRLKDHINIRQISLDETARHASKRYLSTLAVLQLNAILACARLVKTGKPEKRANQHNSRLCWSCNTIAPVLAASNYW